MILAGVSRVRNEEDIIEAFVRHNLRFIDRLFIIDHRSGDATREILTCLQREGLPIEIFEDRDSAHHQADRSSELSRLVCQKLSPDFIFLLDADEFLVAGNRAYVEEGLSTLPYECHGLIPWRTWVPANGDDKAEPNPIRRIRHRRSEEVQPFYKVVLAAKYWTKDVSQKLTHGNHSVRSNREVAQQLVGHDLFLGHFPVRTVSQFITKILVHWLALLMDPAYDPDSTGSFQFRDLFHSLVRSGGPLNETVDLEAIGRQYAVLPEFVNALPPLVHDPLPCDFSIKYSAASSDPLIVLAKAAEDMILEASCGEHVDQKLRLECERLRAELKATRSRLDAILHSRFWRLAERLRNRRTQLRQILSARDRT